MLGYLHQHLQPVLHHLPLLLVKVVNQLPHSALIDEANLDPILADKEAVIAAKFALTGSQ